MRSTDSGSKDFGALFLCLAAVTVTATIGASFTPGPWYDALNKPSWNPPDWVFGPVWGTLYLLMAVAAWLVWRRRHHPPDVRPALVLWLIHLALNAGWSWLFFGLHRPREALVEIVALWIAIAITTALFRRHSAVAAALLAPYLAWVGFAAYLNYTIWQLN